MQIESILLLYGYRKTQDIEMLQIDNIHGILYPFYKNVPQYASSALKVKKYFRYRLSLSQKVYRKKTEWYQYTLPTYFFKF